MVKGFFSLVGILFLGTVVGCSGLSPSDLETQGVMARHQVENADAKSKSPKKKRSRRSKKRKKSRKVASVKKKKSAVKDILESKSARKIRYSQARRFDKIRYYKKKLYIGEMDTGRLGLRPQVRIPSSVQRKVKLLVKQENSSRERIYKMIIKDNKYNADMEKVLRENFFENYRMWDPQGSYFSVDRNWQN